jgi:formylglycine-generating enzyme required for sulfatase activity
MQMNTSRSSKVRLLCVLLPALLTAAAASAQSALEWQHVPSGIEFVWVDQGCFSMGAEKSGGFTRQGEPLVPRADEVPQHRVCVDGFWMGKHEVTREQWQRVMGPVKLIEASDGRRPATNITWEEAQGFVQRLNARAEDGERFRLPTEAEWEMACQPGEPKLPIREQRNERVEELAASAWTREPRRDDPQTRNVGELAANPLGLHDMLGNVWEWTEDVYLLDSYTRHARDNPRVLSGSDRHVLRGGSFKSDVTQARCGTRAYGVPNDRLPSVGLRVVRYALKAQ